MASAAHDQAALPGLALPPIVCPPASGPCAPRPAPAAPSGDHQQRQPQCAGGLAAAGAQGAGSHHAPGAPTPRGAEALVPSFSVDSTALDAACMAGRPAPAPAAPLDKVNGLPSPSPGLPSPACVAARAQLGPRAARSARARRQATSSGPRFKLPASRRPGTRSGPPSNRPPAACPAHACPRLAHACMLGGQQGMCRAQAAPRSCWHALSNAGAPALPTPPQAGPTGPTPPRARPRKPVPVASSPTASSAPARSAAFRASPPVGTPRGASPPAAASEGGAAAPLPRRRCVLVAKQLTNSDASSGRIILPRVAVESNLSFVLGYRHYALAVRDCTGAWPRARGCRSPALCQRAACPRRAQACCAAAPHACIAPLLLVLLSFAGRWHMPAGSGPCAERALAAPTHTRTHTPRLRSPPGRPPLRVHDQVVGQWHRAPPRVCAGAGRRVSALARRGRGRRGGHLHRRERCARMRGLRAPPLHSAAPEFAAAAGCCVCQLLPLVQTAEELARRQRAREGC